AADPVKRIQARTTTTVFAPHLPDYYFRIRIHVKRRGFQVHSTLKRLKERCVLCYVIVLVANPFCDPDGARGITVDDDANARGSRVSTRSAIDIGNQVRHSSGVQMRFATRCVRKIVAVNWFVWCVSNRALFGSVWKNCAKTQSVVN